MNRRSEEVQLGMFGREEERLGHPLFTERWSNRKAFRIGVMAGQGMTAAAICNALNDGSTPNLITAMFSEWGFKVSEGEHTHKPVKVMLAGRHRTMLADEARNREIDMPELCRRVLVQVAQDDMYRAILEL
jgi:hypothetical protein